MNPTALSPTTVQELLAAATRRLSIAGLERPALEATALACHCLGLDKASLLAHPERPVDLEHARRCVELIERRAGFEPLAYITGEREFYGRSFAVDRRVMIPRPETELLVETALEELRKEPPEAWIVDVGTGSGCVAATLALEVPAAQIVAADVSAAALEVARRNVERHGLSGRVRLVRGNLLGWLQPGSGNRGVIVVANLPYIPAEAFDALPPDVRRFEPRLALDGGPGGTRLLAELLEQASELGVGLLLAELDPRHADVVQAMAQRCFPDQPVAVLPDLAGHPRLLRAGRAR